MNNLQQRIKSWLVNPKKFASQSRMQSERELLEDISEVNLHLDSLTCIRKNEISPDEIAVLAFWLVERGDDVSVAGVISTTSKFKRTGERFDVNLCIPIIPNTEGGTFCVMVYEEDAPFLLDAHDPIGLVAFHQNGGICVYSGDFRTVENPIRSAFNLNSGQEATMGEKNSGSYKLKYHFSTVANS